MPRYSGTHYQGPILGSDRAGAGLFEDVPIGATNDMNSKWKVYSENFRHTIADATAFAELGVTATAVGAVAANAITSGPANFHALNINPGTAADTGWELQFNAASSQATYVNNRFDIMPAMTPSSTVTPANREWFMYCRFSLRSNATSWDGKALIGWFVTDTSLLSPTTGLPTVTTGAGVGFHVGEDGVINYVCDDGTITAAGTTIESVGTLVANTDKWYECGFRAKVTEFSTQTGNVDFYFGKLGAMQRIASTRQAGTFPVAAVAYSPSIAILNGPTNLSDMRVESLITGINTITSL